MKLRCDTCGHESTIVYVIPEFDPTRQLCRTCVVAYKIATRRYL